MSDLNSHKEEMVLAWGAGEPTDCYCNWCIEHMPVLKQWSDYIDYDQQGKDDADTERPAMLERAHESYLRSIR